MIILLTAYDLSARAFPGYAGSIIKLPENENAIIVEKKTQTLFLYASRGHGLRLELQMPCSTGEVAGRKSLDGDKKTPEGVYFLTDEHEDKYLSPIYGTKAFPTDYPNFIDKATGKTGSAIWIHGTNKKLKAMDSNGCVALENENIEKLAEYVNLNSTPVILVEKINEPDEVKTAGYLHEINNILNQLVLSVERGSYHDYLSFYSSGYLPDTDWWNRWLELRENGGKSDSEFRIKIEKVGIYYHDNQFVALFDYILCFKEREKYIGKRKIFLKDQGGSFKIIGDVFQTLEAGFQNGGVSFIKAAEAFIK